MKSAATEKLCFRLRVPMLFILWVVLLGTVAYGQGTATIVGTVTDPTGAVVPNAKITITNLDNGFVRTSTTNAAGNYTRPRTSHRKQPSPGGGIRLQNLRPDRYLTGCE